MSTGTLPSNRFPGQWFQSESGLHQNWMRDYDPTTGRYLQADPLGLIDGASVYGYVKQNPGRHLDPSGQCVGPLAIACAAGAGAIIGGAIYLGYHYLFDDPCETWTWSGLAAAMVDGAVFGAIGWRYGGAAGAGGGGAAGGFADHISPFLDDLLKGGAAADRNGLTAAGRALQKHGSRPGSAFPPTTGPAATVNQAGQAELSSILNSPGVTFRAGQSGRYGAYVDVIAPNGKGARFASDGTFIGFLEP